MFERTEIAEAIYKGGATSKNNPQAESDRASSGRKKKGGASASQSNPRQGCSDKCNRSNAGHPSDEPTRAKKTCLLHGPGQSSEEYKVIREYTEKRSAQLTYQDKQARSGGNKHGIIVKFESATEEVNIIKSHDEPIPKKRKIKGRVIKPIMTKPMQIHQRMDAIMDLAVNVLENLHRTRK